jgi:hypothetical protein
MLIACAAIWLTPNATDTRSELGTRFDRVR